jgi:hypothetical protein
MSLYVSNFFKTPYSHGINNRYNCYATPDFENHHTGKHRIKMNYKYVSRSFLCKCFHAVRFFLQGVKEFTNATKQITRCMVEDLF